MSDDNDKNLTEFNFDFEAWAADNPQRRTPEELGLTDIENTFNLVHGKLIFGREDHLTEMPMFYETPDKLPPSREIMVEVHPLVMIEILQKVGLWRDDMTADELHKVGQQWLADNEDVVQQWIFDAWGVDMEEDGE